VKAAVDARLAVARRFVLVAGGGSSSPAVRLNFIFWPAEHFAITVSLERLIEQTVLFALRGGGLKEEVISVIKNAKAFGVIAADFVFSNGVR